MSHDFFSLAPRAIPRVKICGITRHEDARRAVDLGADALGFVHYPPSPRHLEMSAVAELASACHTDVLCVGVVVHPTKDIVGELAEAGLDAVQIHGTLNDEVLRIARITGLSVIRAVRVGSRQDVESALAKAPASLPLLFDAKADDGWGGTGTSFDWSWLAAATSTRQRRWYMLAGGLDASNVREAIRQLHPPAIDLSSGVETEPGIKSSDKLHSFFRTLQDESI